MRMTRFSDVDATGLLTSHCARLCVRRPPSSRACERAQGLVSPPWHMCNHPLLGPLLCLWGFAWWLQRCLVARLSLWLWWPPWWCACATSHGCGHWGAGARRTVCLGDHRQCGCRTVMQKQSAGCQRASRRDHQPSAQTFRGVLYCELRAHKSSET